MNLLRWAREDIWRVGKVSVFSGGQKAQNVDTEKLRFYVLWAPELELWLRFRIFSKPDQNGFFPLFIGPKSNHSLALSGRFPLCIKDLFAYNLSQLWHGFVIKVICISRPSPNKTKLKFDLYSSIGLKNSINLKDPMLWVRCAFDNVLFEHWNYHEKGKGKN